MMIYNVRENLFFIQFIHLKYNSMVIKYKVSLVYRSQNSAVKWNIYINWNHKV